jgi:hypothetical protein
MTMSTSMLTPAAAIQYVRGGRGRATLVGRERRYTYSFGVPKGQDSPIFVRVLVGPDNTTDYEFVGSIAEDRASGRLALYAGAKGNAAHPAFAALQWWLKAAQVSSVRAMQAQFWHEGVCCRCGRVLTTPESIAAGIGPVCATK